MEMSRDAGSNPAASTQSHFARDRQVAFLMHLRRFRVSQVPSINGSCPIPESMLLGVAGFGHRLPRIRRLADWKV